MPKNRKLQNVIGTEHIKDAAEAEIAAQASGGATVAFKNVAVSGQDNIVADASADTLNVAGAGSVSVTTNAANDTLTITGTDTNTQLSTEQVQDIVGAMFTGNTETGITATYEDSDGTIDLVASGGSPGGSDGQMQYNNGGSFGGSSLVYTDTTDAEQFKIDVSSSETPLVIVQEGAGNSFEVHDAADPDNNRFQISNVGNVTIKGLNGGGFGEALYVGGNTISNRFKVQSGSASDNSFSHAQDTNTGIHFPAADNLGFATAGTERLRVGSSGQIGIAGANYGNSGQVLTSGGASGAVSWTTVSGGGGGLAKGVGVGILSADPFANNSSYQSAYPLWACTTNTNGTGWSGYPSTTEVHLIPFQVPVDGDLAELAFRTSGSSWGPITTYWAIYGVGSDNLPVGAPLFNTSFSISPGNEYEFSVTGVTGKSAGDLLYFAFLGVTDIATITMQIGNMRDGGLVYFPKKNK